MKAHPSSRPIGSIVASRARWSHLGSQTALLESAFLAVAFFILSLVRLTTPAHYLFDETYYIPAALKLLAGAEIANREHPMVGKEILALSIGLFGDNPVGWRAPSAILMPLALFMAMRSLWTVTRDRIATLIFGVLLVTGCLFNVLARVGTLDAPMLFFASGGIYCFLRDLVRPSACYRVAAAILLGLSLGCKWTIAPMLPLVALAWALDRGVSFRRLIEAGAWFGAVPLAIYLSTFAPGFFVARNALHLAQILPLQLDMARALAGYDRPNFYSSNWWEWFTGTAPFWVLAGQDGGSWRCLVLTLNPVSAWLVAVAVVIAGWLARREAVWRLPLAFYALPIVIAASGPARVNFVHHYALSFAIGLAIAAVLLARLSRARWLGPIVIAAAAAFFAFLFPALTAAPLPGREAAQRFVILPSWQFVDAEAWRKRGEAGPGVRLTRLRACLDAPGTC